MGYPSPDPEMALQFVHILFYWMAYIFAGAAAIGLSVYIVLVCSEIFSQPRPKKRLSPPPLQHLRRDVLLTPSAPTLRPRWLPVKYVVFAFYGVLMIVVWVTRDRLLLDPNSWLRQHYAPIPALMFIHAIAGAIALFLGIFQFSSRLRERYLHLHRLMGQIYAVCVVIAAPAAIAIAMTSPIPTIRMASAIHTSGWMLTTATAIYCLRTRRTHQHREWMMRSYAFAVVFVFVRVIVAIPPVARAGTAGVAEVVWSVIAVACFLPSFLIEWQKLVASRRISKVRAAAIGS